MSGFTMVAIFLLALVRPQQELAVENLKPAKEVADRHLSS